MTCIAINAVIPTAIRLPNISGDFIAINIPLHINTANSSIINVHPKNPSSSPIIENMKSLCGSGMYKYFCVLSPNPTPKSPPDPIAYKLCITCHPSPVASCHGSKNVNTLCNLYGSNTTNTITIGIRILPAVKKCLNLHPATNIITTTIPNITTDALKCGCSNRSPMIGNTQKKCFKNPFLNFGNSSLFFTNIPA